MNTSSFLNMTSSPKNTSHSFFQQQDPQRKYQKYKLLEIFEKIQNPQTEKSAITSYLSFLSELNLYDPSDKTIIYILKHISTFITSLPIPSKKPALKLYSSFFLAFHSLESPSLITYLDYILTSLQSHLTKDTTRLLANCFESIVKNINSLSQEKSLSIINNMLYNYSNENDDIKYGMICLKKLIENSTIISSDNYYEDIVNNLLFNLYSNTDIYYEDDIKIEILNCIIRVILLKESHYKMFAKQTLDTVYVDMIHVNSNLQKKVLNVIYLLVLYCSSKVIPFANEVIQMIRRLKGNKDKHVRENAVLILQLYSDISSNESAGDMNKSVNVDGIRKCLKRSGSQEQIVFNKKNDSLHISRNYCVRLKSNKSCNKNKRSSLGRCRSHTNLIYNGNNRDNSLNTSYRGTNSSSNNKLKGNGHKIKEINTSNRLVMSGLKPCTPVNVATSAKSPRHCNMKLVNKDNINVVMNENDRQQDEEINGKLSISDLNSVHKEKEVVSDMNKQVNNNNCSVNVNDNYNNDFKQLLTISKQIEEITGRMDMLLTSMNKLRGDTSLQISTLNSRVNAMESTINSVLPQQQQQEQQQQQQSQYEQQQQPQIEQHIPSSQSYSFNPNVSSTPLQLLFIKPTSLLEEQIYFTLENQNEDELLNIISVTTANDIKSFKNGFVDEIIVSLLGIAMRGKQIHTIISFIQLCLDNIKHVIKIPTISTVRDILIYIINNKYSELNQNDLNDIQQMISLLQ